MTEKSNEPARLTKRPAIHDAANWKIPSEAIRRYGLQVPVILSLLVVLSVLWIPFVKQCFEHCEIWNSVRPWGKALIFGVLIWTPYLTCLVLLQRRKLTTVAAGAGIACGLGGIPILLSPYLLLLFGLTQTPESSLAVDKSMEWVHFAVVAYVLLGLWVLVASLFLSRYDLATFSWMALLTIILVPCAFVVLNPPSSAGNSEGERAAGSASLARNRLIALAGCVERKHMENPDAGYLVHLDLMNAEPTCGKMPLGGVPSEFDFRYETRMDDKSERATEYQISATRRKEIPGERSMLMATGGIFYAVEKHTLAELNARHVNPSDRWYSQIDQIKKQIDLYEQQHKTAPERLAKDMMGLVAVFVADDGLRMEVTDYDDRYLGPERLGSSKFAITARCLAYGKRCVRSFYLDYDGNVHGTGEPRAATENDPVSAQCETGTTNCEDTDWRNP
jgi:hypothetical protein